MTTDTEFAVSPYDGQMCVVDRVMVVTYADGHTRPRFIYKPELLAERAAERRAALAVWQDAPSGSDAERAAWAAYEVARDADPMARA